MFYASKEHIVARVFSNKDSVRNVLQEALECGNQTEMEKPNGSELFEELQRDFPQAKIVVLTMSELLAAQESDQNEEE